MSNKIWGSVWKFMVAHWHVLVVAIVVVVGVCWWKDCHASAAISQINKANQQEIATVQKALDTEQAQHQQEVAQLQTTLDQVQKQYQVAQDQLVVQQAREQTQIVKKYSNDPVGLANLLAGKMGFTVQQ
jgi:cytoskeletal protein RodZ